MKLSRLLLPLAGLFAILAGCQRGSIVEDEKIADLTPGEVKIYSTPPVTTLTVTFESDTEPVSVYIVESTKSAAAQDNVLSGKGPASSLTKTEKPAKSGTLTATATGKTELTVLVSADRKTKAKVKLSGK